jgi:hypothetical protein
MEKLPEYNFVDDIFTGMETCPIKIMSGQFKDIVFRYGKISLNETEDGNVKVNMDITMVQYPENFNQQNEEFTNILGEIFVDIIKKNTEEKKEQNDLEDDVHRD